MAFNNSYVMPLIRFNFRRTMRNLMFVCHLGSKTLELTYKRGRKIYQGQAVGGESIFYFGLASKKSDSL